MSLDVKVVGEQDFFAAAARLREAGHKVQADKLESAVRRGARHIEDEIRDSVDVYFPNNYARVFVATMVFKTEIRRTRGARATLRLRVPGTHGHDRQIRSLEAGVLKHPVYGRTRPIKNHAKFRAVTYTNPWVEQQIRPGFFSESGDRARPRVTAEIKQAMHEVAEFVEG